MAKKPKPQKEKAEGESEKQKGGMIGKAVMMLAMGAASFGTVYFLPGKDIPPAAEDAHHADPHAPKLTAHDLMQDAEFATLDPMTLSLLDGSRFLKIGLTLEVAAGEAGYIDPNDPKIRDAFTGYLRALDMSQIQDPAFMVQMRTQLLRRARLILGQDAIYSVLITDFLIQ